MNKRKALIITVFIMSLALQACGSSGGNKDVTGTNNDNQDSQAAPEAPAPAPEPDAPVPVPEVPAPEPDAPVPAPEVPAAPEAAPRVRSPGLAEECINSALTDTASNIGNNLPDVPSPYEPSGADWHPRLNKVFSVHDNGYLFMMNKDGSEVTTWFVGGDLEGITIADPESSFVYIGREFPAAVLEFNIQTGLVTRTFSLGAFMPENNSQGLEALTFVEKQNHPEGGQFWAGHQGNGQIYVFDLPIRTSNALTTVTHAATFNPVVGRTDLSGMDYSPEFDVVYVIYDASNRLVIVDPDNGSVYFDRNLPQNDQEGIAVNDLCELFIAQDTNKSFWVYEAPNLN